MVNSNFSNLHAMRLTKSVYLEALVKADTCSARPSSAISTRGRGMPKKLCRVTGNCACDQQAVSLSLVGEPKETEKREKSFHPSIFAVLRLKRRDRAEQGAPADSGYNADLEPVELHPSGFRRILVLLYLHRWASAAAALSGVG